MCRRRCGDCWSETDISAICCVQCSRRHSASIHFNSEVLVPQSTHYLVSLKINPQNARVQRCNAVTSLVYVIWSEQYYLPIWMVIDFMHTAHEIQLHVDRKFHRVQINQTFPQNGNPNTYTVTTQTRTSTNCSNVLELIVSYYARNMW